MISFARRREITKKLVEDLLAMGEQCQKEYAHDEGNALGNFERLAEDLKLPREKVLWVYMKKHMDGILAHINGFKSQREPVQGRIIDAIVYLMLLYCMVVDDKEQEDKKVFNGSGG
jgi:hypothetical protein